MRWGGGALDGISFFLLARNPRDHKIVNELDKTFRHSKQVTTKYSNVITPKLPPDVCNFHVLKRNFQTCKDTFDSEVCYGICCVMTGPKKDRKV